jgi:hypothetical protein
MAVLIFAAMRTFIAVAIISLAFCACGSSSQPSSSGASPAVTAASTAQGQSAPPTPSPTPKPPDRKLAARQYLAAAEKSNTAFKALDKKYEEFGTLARARTYFKASAKIDLAFVNAIRKINFPADTRSDAKTLIRRVLAVQALEIEGSGVKSWSAVTSVNNALVRAARLQVAAANLVRNDLRLPPVHL